MHFLTAQDSRCYLEGGGSAESFLVSEDIAVGTVVGRLRINGNASDPSGDISLSLRERDSPVQIAVGSKDLVLKRVLDKEGLLGPASVYVNVICDRRHSTDPVSDFLTARVHLILFQVQYLNGDLLKLCLPRVL